MQPFNLSKGASILTARYLDPALFRSNIPLLSEEERANLLRIWVTEGVPFAFQHCPMLYGSIRAWLATRFGITQEAVALVGSARIGFALTTKSNYGRAFGPHSDLDLAIVSDGLFRALEGEFALWKEQFESGRAVPRNDTEGRYWLSNAEETGSQLRRGFIDDIRIPNLYPSIKFLNNTRYVLIEKLKVTPHAPFTKRTSFRVYRDWRAFIAQLNRNLNYLSESFSRSEMDY